MRSKKLLFSRTCLNPHNLTPGELRAGLPLEWHNSWPWWVQEQHNGAGILDVFPDVRILRSC